MIVYPLSYRIPVKIGEITFWISPLSYGAKQEVLSLVKVVAGEETGDRDLRERALIKHGVKEVEGLKLPDGSDYKLEFDPSGALTEESLEVVLQADTQSLAALKVLHFMLNKWEEKVEGVEVDLAAARPAKKN